MNKDDFENIFRDPEAMRALHKAEVDVLGLVDFAETMFHEERGLTYRDFMELLLQFSCTNNATLRDLVDLRENVSRQLIDIKEEITTNLKPIRHNLRSITELEKHLESAFSKAATTG